MPTLFTRIIDGELPGRFVWEDEVCVAFLVIDPITDGHTVVVPRLEIDEWTDADVDLLGHLMSVSQYVGQALKTAFDTVRAGVMIEGFEVPHLHIHVFGANSHDDFDLSKIVHGQDGAILDANAERLRAQLRADGHAAQVPS